MLTGLVVTASVLIQLATAVMAVRLIKKRRQAEETLRESERKLVGITSNLAEGIYVFAPDGRLTFMNPEAERLFGWTIDELNERGPHELVHFRRADGSPLPFEECSMHRVIETGRRFYSTDEVFVRKDGTVFPISAITAPIMEGGKAVASVTAFRDITELKKMEEELKKSLREKELLLGEVHHRVKNNMMFISSLLSLQSGSLKDPKAVEIFKESQNRIRTMMVIYKKLYQSHDLTNVDFDSYIRELTTSLFGTYNVYPERIALELDITPAPVSIETAIPCGLIINELISNSIKYAFPGDRRGKISVSIKRTDGDEIELTVADDGAGLPEGLDEHNADSFGLKLVNVMVKQLGGQYRVNRTGGTEFIILFKGVRPQHV